jgi:CRP/FNR family cyclic AMP-dependent transcriptional regulator
MSQNMTNLSGLPLFSLLSETERNTLAELFTTVDARRGERLFRRGDPGNSLYIVRRGRIQITLEDLDGQRIILSENGPGVVFGEVSLLDGGPRTADALAAVDSELLMLDRDDLLEFVTKHPPASLALLTVMGQRLRSTNELLRSHASRNANDEEQARQTASTRAAQRLAGVLGSWGFVIIAVGLAIAGLIFALIRSGAGEKGLDPLELWIGCGLVLVLIQIAALLMTRKHQVEVDRLRAELDYQFDLKAELELAMLNKKLDDLSERFRSQLAGLELDKALGAPVRTGPQ